MESSKFSFGTSLKVPNVQELAKEQKITVPARYVRPDQDPTITVDPIISLLEIPIIDMEKLLLGESVAFELERLHSACKDWGFFQLVNHGVSPTLIEKMELEIQEFFKLPLEEKKKYCQTEGEVEGYGQAFVVSENQKLDWGDMFFLTTLPPHLRKPHLFDELPPSFRETLGAYAMELQKLAMAILGFMARALGMKAEEMKELFEEGLQSIRTNYYPTCPQPESVIGLSPHSDASGLTILRQVSEIEGLQIKKDGMWIPVKPLPNSFTINIGDVLEIVSNGMYRSIEHRATVNSMHERLSIAAFHNPKLTGEIGPAPSLISPQTPPQFRRVSVEKYLKELFTRKLEGKAYVDYLRIDSGEGNASSN
ncbi:oxoglutarate-dependent flavonoid 7-O-demethylase 1-like [Magnolia sinica]|uniref:oxoglutarate-dependent flavonoid 7-O-demethylase 1-like n=1 Tax=Magnolia sinica TaxID=86752 RepID=UPI00265984FA|nr:oxoglutarate-dependent flavonoid 7-O-demethylase 1-like [Magnolia sinica]